MARSGSRRLQALAGVAAVLALGAVTAQAVPASAQPARAVCQAVHAADRTGRLPSPSPLQRVRGRSSEGEATGSCSAGSPSRASSAR